MVIVYKVVAGQTQFIQVETTSLTLEDWTIHERGPDSKRTRTAATKAVATRRLRENSVYLDPDHVPIRIKQVKEGRKQPYPL